MFYVLTGGIQTGKTRWLKRLIDDLQVCGVGCFGVISPGIWRTIPDRDGIGSVGYEKLGIESLLLPGGTRSTFAWRRDLAMREDNVDEKWQSSQAALGWAISDEALDEVNRHFDALESQVVRTAFAGPEAIGRAGLLVVDELGRLELEKGGGFTSATRLLTRGPTPLYQHALVVARDWLANRARDRFAVVWKETQIILPDEEARCQIMTAWE
jgi:nucleoside-triphosphatase THEP1